MVSSRKSPPADPENRATAVGAVEAALGEALAEFVKEGASVSVALSGGVDSIVLLDSLARLAPRHSIALSAIHVHHGLSPNAQAWAEFCAAQCEERGLRFALHRLQLARKRGRSLEALARSARYELLLAEDVDVVALAHHADDQAETVLLQMLRGAGPHGLAAMPAYRPGRPALLRPLLDLPRAVILACAKARQLAWIEDESNADRAHARNALRHDIAPILAARFAGYPLTLARAARHQAEAAQLLDELARSDAAGAIDAAGLDSGRLGALSRPRARNLLRWFLRAQGLRTPSEGRLADMLRQLVDAGANARTCIVLDDVEIGRHRGRITVHAPPPEAFELPWHGELEVALPGGVLAFQRELGAGLAGAQLERTRVTLRSRVGGERIRLAADRPTRTVKQLLQEAHVAPWLRQSLPLVWCDDELAAVPGLGVALKFQAAPGEAGWTLDWRPAVLAVKSAAAKQAQD
ncbi:MAG TPA: tRNA lysidine(34) synthetase TilS [Casimicrobiaceae bacterium]|nr:tRNA lysidine(34) synthetase TilS [Casimicrobiaceae bacterium]